MLWVALPQAVFGLLAMYLLRDIDARLILTAGFTLVAIACLINAQLSPAWSGANFWLSQAVMAVGLALAFNAMVGAIVLEVIDTGALSRPIDVLTFAGYFQTLRLFGGEAGAAFMQHFIAVREQFHSNILGLGVQLGERATSQRLEGLSAGVASSSTGAAAAVARAGKILGLQVRQQAFTLAITDSFTMVAWSVVCSLVVIACMRRVSTQYQQVVIADSKVA
jgi:DHA2 family multidrug resistance protein